MVGCWSDLKEWLRTSADILRWRRDVRRDQANDAKWNGLRPAQLAVARDWPKRRRDELAAEEVKWIKRGILSERIRGGIVATVVRVVALLAGIAWWQKNEAENRKEAAQGSEKKANDARDQADGLINFMLYNPRDKFVPIGRSDVLNDVARKAKEYLERLPIELVNAGAKCLPARLEHSAKAGRARQIQRRLAAGSVDQLQQGRRGAGGPRQAARGAR